MTQTNETVVHVENASKQYFLGAVVHALRQVSLTVKSGEFLVIVGPSGSGKTSLLNLIGCIERTSSGKVYIRGEDVTELSPDRLAATRAHKIGFIFQTFNLLPTLSVAENVEFPLYFRKELTARQRLDKVMAALEDVGILKFAGHNPRQLSGGQRQRAAIARALVGSPAIILADEPTANLDSSTGYDILQLMKGLNRSRGVTFIFSTHDQKVMSLASRVVKLVDGKLLTGEIHNQ